MESELDLSATPDGKHFVGELYPYTQQCDLCQMELTLGHFRDYVMVKDHTVSSDGRELVDSITDIPGPCPKTADGRHHVKTAYM